LGTFKPLKLSLTSTRLLMTSQDTKQLIQLDVGCDELRRVQLPDDMEPRHAVESPTGTFVISHKNTQFNTAVEQWQVSEVNTDGNVLRLFTGSCLPSLGYTPHVAIDIGGNIFLADRDNHQLTVRQVIVEELTSAQLQGAVASVLQRTNCWLGWWSSRVSPCLKCFVDR